MIASTLILAWALAASPGAHVFFQYGPYEAGIPKPESVLGYGPGERHTVFRDQERALLAIAERAKARVRVFEFGKSVEGRPLRVFAVSSPKNIARLEEIRKGIGRLSDPKPGEDYGKLIEDTPPIVWINECIHGDETASFESAMWLLYNLAASRNAAIERALENAVLILNPAYNPDGHERYVVWYNGVAAGSPSGSAYEHSAPSIARGRTNHYRFDMNRDRVSLSQDETRQEVAEFLRWNPQVYVDQHGQLENYFFPPNPMSVNANVGRDRLNKWTGIFGRATAEAFDRNGWLYFIKRDFDFYFAGYLDTWAALQGAIGMTHETDHGASIRETREDGSIATLRGGMEKHFTSAIAVLRASGERRKELLSDFLKFKLDAVTGRHAGKNKGIVLAGEWNDLLRLQRILHGHGIRGHIYGREIQLESAHDFWTGASGRAKAGPYAMLVSLADRAGPLAKALFDPQSDFEEAFVREQLRRRELEKRKEPDPDAGDYEFYDMTGWSMAFGHGLKAWWIEDPKSAPSNVITDTAPSVMKRGERRKPSPIGYAVRYRTMEDLLAVVRLTEEGVRIHVSTRDLRAGSAALPAGTFLLLKARNEEDLERHAELLAAAPGTEVVPLETSYPSEGAEGPGSRSVQPVRPPSIAVAFGDPASPSAFGAVWYLFEREFRLPFTPIANAPLARDLSEFSCVVFPPGRFTVSAKLREWVQEGGCAVVLGGGSWALGSSGFVELQAVKVESKSPTYVPGSLFEAWLDARSFLAYGYPSEDGKAVRIAAPVSGSTFYQAAESGSVLTMPKEESKVRLLSGWSWPDETPKALAGTVWAQVQRVGRGNVVFFVFDPAERAMWPGLWKMLLNAIVFGPQ